MEEEDSFHATGPGPGPDHIGFWAAQAWSAGSRIGALLRGTEAGCVSIVGQEIKLMHGLRCFGVGGESDKGDGLIGISSGDSDDNGVYGEHLKSGNGVRGLSYGGTGVRGISIGGDTGVTGQGFEGVPSEDTHLIIGVKGITNSSIGFGVYGENIGNAGVKGSNDGVRGVTWSNGYYKGKLIPWSKEENEGIGAGVVEINNGDGSGVVGWSRAGDGILGIAEDKHSLIDERHGVHGMSNYHNGSGVWGENIKGGIGVKGSANEGTGVLGTSSGIGVVGDTNSDNGHGVSGINHAGGTGVEGSSVGGTGVEGRSLHGYGGDFSGGLAQLHLSPGPAPGRPTDNNNHKLGELYLDSVGSLFLCISAGTPGNWVQIQVQPVP